MSATTVMAHLSDLRRKLKPVLESQNLYILDQAKKQVEQTYGHYRDALRGGRQVTPWGYEISKEAPLTFRRAMVRGANYRVDIACRFRWLDSDIPLEQDMVIRVWSLDKNVYFRPDWDNENMLGPMEENGGRVMLRYHFDKANVGQSGPVFHMQTGGNSSPEEFCWLHEAVSIPRIPTQPMDLVLACELVVENFFPEESPILDDPVMNGYIQSSQRELLLSYYEKCLEAIKNDKRLLQTLSTSTV